MKVTKRMDDKQDRDKTEGKMTEDGTVVDHNKQDIDDLNKETKMLSVEGVSEDGCQERGYEVTTNGEPYAYIDEGKEEQKETSSESSDTEGEQEVNRAIRDQVWPGTRATARKINVRHKAVKDDKNKGESKSSSEDEESYPGGEQETNQVTWDHIWPGTRDSRRWK